MFVDELDRCRPNFAIDMLEIIKHTFDVEGVSFVLITNTQQLKASINHCYGQAVDAQRYLDKFIKFRFELSGLSSRNAHVPVFVAKQHFLTLAQEKNIITPDNLSGKHFEKAVEDLIRVQNLSLREVETLIRHIHIARILSDGEILNGQKYFAFIMTDLISIILVCFKPELLNQIKNGSFDINALGEFLGVKKLSLGSQSPKPPRALEVMMMIIAKDSNQNTEKYTPPEDQMDTWDYYAKGFLGNGFHTPSSISEIIKTANILAFE